MGDRAGGADARHQPVPVPVGPAGRIPTQADGTTGHVWDGIREGLHKLPWWWIAGVRRRSWWSSATWCCIPGSATSRACWAGVRPEQHAATTPLPTTRSWTRGSRHGARSPSSRWRRTGSGRHRAGASTWTTAPHAMARSAHGNPHVGAPDLTDDDWQYGGDGDAILASILDGRSAVMPPWGKALRRRRRDEVAAYVQSLGGHASREWLVRAGQEHYDMFCVVLPRPRRHQAVPMVAPNLTDHAWLYGDDWATSRPASATAASASCRRGAHDWAKTSPA